MATDLTPQRLSLLDQARAEARDDLDKLVAHFAAKRQAVGESPAVSEMVHGLLGTPAWDRLELATALGEALARLTTLAPPAEPAHPTTVAHRCRCGATTTERTPDDHRL